MVTSHSLPEILTALSSEEPQLRAGGALHLSAFVDALSGEQAGQLGEYMRSAGAVDLLAELLDDSDPQLPQWVLGTLANLCSDAFDPASAATKAILRDCNAMTEELTALKGGLAGRLALGVVPSALPMVVALTQAMRRRHADVRFAVYSRTSDEILREVQEFQLDAGITYLDNEPVRHMTTLDLYAERYRLFVPHDHALAARTSIGWAEAATETFCLLTPNMQNRRIINQAFEAAGVQPEPPIETDSIINVWAHIKFAGLSSILPEYFNELLAPDTAIRSIPLEHSGPAHRVGLITLERDPLSPLVSALFDTCRDRRFFPLDIEATNR